MIFQCSQGTTRTRSAQLGSAAMASPRSTHALSISSLSLSQQSVRRRRSRSQGNPGHTAVHPGRSSTMDPSHYTFHHFSGAGMLLLQSIQKLRRGRCICGSLCVEIYIYVGVHTTHVVQYKKTKASQQPRRHSFNQQSNTMENFYIFLLLAAGLALPCLAASPTTSLLYPYGKAQGDSENPVADDGNSPAISIKKPFPFYGNKYNNIFVNNNGVVSFGRYVSEYTPNAFPLENEIPFVAPFWADVDNRVSGNIFSRQSEDSALLSRFATDLRRYHPDFSFTPVWMFIATWDKVGYYGSASEKVNTFQAVLATDGEISFIMLNYADIQWTTGTGNDGDIYTGLGGTPAQAGFDSGDKVNYYNIPGSRTPEILNIKETTNIGESGRWLFQVDKSIIGGVPTPQSDCLNK